MFLSSGLLSRFVCPRASPSTSLNAMPFRSLLPHFALQSFATKARIREPTSRRRRSQVRQERERLERLKEKKHWYPDPKEVRALRQEREKAKLTEHMRAHERPEGSYVYSTQQLEQFKERVKHIPHKFARARAVGKTLSAMADPQEIIQLRKLAKRGDKEAQLHLGLMYLLGDDLLEVDLGLAKKWLSRAAEQNDPEAQYFLGAMYARGLVDPAHNSQSNEPRDPSQIALNDYREAIRLWTLAAQQGHADSMFRLASLMYEAEHGKSELLNLEKARMWLETATRQEPPLPQVLVMLGSMLLDGKGGSPDKARAVTLFKRAVEEFQDPVGHFSLGLLHYQGEAGLPLDLDAARLHFTAAAEAGLPGAQRMLAEMLRSGEGGHKDEAGAELWLQRAKHGDEPEQQLPRIELASPELQEVAGPRPSRKGRKKRDHVGLLAKADGM